MRIFVTYFLPVVIIAISIPMVLGKVPPNGLYGFRTPKTLSSSEVWYPANRMSGWFMIGAGVLGLGANLLLVTRADEEPRRLVFWMASLDTGFILLAVLLSFLYLRRL